MTTELATQLLENHEGLELALYQCPAGKWTIGYGRNLEDVGISVEEADFMLGNDIARCQDDLERFHFWQKLNMVRKSVLIDMRYNLGPGRFRQFKLMLDALLKDDYSRASSEMLNSRWASQVKGRAVRLAKMMKYGVCDG